MKTYGIFIVYRILYVIFHKNESEKHFKIMKSLCVKGWQTEKVLHLTDIIGKSGTD